MMSVAASRQADGDVPASTPSQIDGVIVATVSHLLQTPAIATAIAHELGTNQARGLRHLRRMRGVLPRRRPGQRHDPRPVAPKHVLVIGVERLTDITSPPIAGPRSSSPTARAPSSSDLRTRQASGRSCGAPTVRSSTTSARPRTGATWWPPTGRDAYLVMQGSSVFRWASYEMAKVAQATLDAPGSPSTTSTSSCRTRRTAGSSTRWPGR